MPASLAAYLTFTVLFVITPGAATAVVIRSAVEGGRRAGVATATGVATANGSHAAAAGLGLAVLLRESPRVFLVVQMAGAAYLAWLGLVSLRRAVRAERRSAAPDPARLSRGSAFRDGLAVNLANPAVMTFYLAAVPTFLAPDAGVAAFAGLAAMHVTLAFACHSCWAVAFDRLRRLFARPAFARLLEGAAGVALVLLAVRLAARAL
jgi:threonine/homoserine/homoserine lactone efflux protein